MTLLVAATLVAISAVSLLIAIDWYQKNNEYKNILEGYIDKAAYDSCLDKAKSDNEYSNLIADIKCEKEWGVWKRVKKERLIFGLIF